jgi:hypothetical protein
MRSIRPTIGWSAVLLAAVLGSACTHRAGLDDVPAATSGDLDAGTRDADAQQTWLYERCIGHNDGSRGSCSAGEICGSMPNVGYAYCMPAPPCPAGMVSVINLACAYPCDDERACATHGLSRCAENTLAEFTAGPYGWCTP